MGIIPNTMVTLADLMNRWEFSTWMIFFWYRLNDHQQQELKQTNGLAKEKKIEARSCSVALLVIPSFISTANVERTASGPY